MFTSAPHRDKAPQGGPPTRDRQCAIALRLAERTNRLWQPSPCANDRCHRTGGSRDQALDLDTEREDRSAPRACQTRAHQGPGTSTVLLLVFLFILRSINGVHATHLSGGEITYMCVAFGQYQVNIDLYYDCNSAVIMPSAWPLNVNGACGSSFTSNLPLAAGMPTQVTTSCPGTASACDVPPGNGPGMQRFTYTGLVNLPAACGAWSLSTANCCRNAAILNLQSPLNDSIYIESIINPGVAPCNASPVFTGAPIPVVCAGVPVNFSFAGTDPDGDQLTYQLVAAWSAPNTPVGYLPLFSPADPIQGIALDTATGQVTFTANQGTYVVAVLVSEWDPMGQFIGSVRRDMQFLVQNCTGTPPPVPTSSSIDPGTAIPLGPYEYAVCAGSSLNLQAEFAISDPNEVLVLTSTVSNVLPGAFFSQSGSSPAIASVLWAPPAGATGSHTFTITSTDNDCPLANTSTIAITVHLSPEIQVNANADSSICEGAVAALSSMTSGGTGPLETVWSNGLAGNGPHLIFPVETSTFIVTAIDSLGCASSDSSTIVVHPLPEVSIGVNDPEQCLRTNEFILQNLTPSDMVGTPCIWDLGDGSISNDPFGVTHSYSSTGCMDVTLTVSSPFGCVDSGVLMLCIRPHPEATFLVGEQPTDVLWTHVPFDTPPTDSTGNLSWDWSFGSEGALGQSTEMDPVFTFPDAGPGVYTVTLEVTNVYGCSDTTTKLVVIQGIDQVFIPTAFTPNGDGLNDEFFLVHEGIRPEDFTFTVFDRWGSPVFRSSHPDDRWNGGAAPEGIYTWRVHYADKYTVERIERTGSVVLLR